MAKVLKILTLPKSQKQLRQISTEIDLVKVENKQFQQLITDMVRTMIVKDGIGLAAPQVGQLIRMAVLNTKEGPICMINPSLVKQSLLKEVGEEGCLSIPGVYGNVRRHKTVCCRFVDHTGVERQLEAKGLLARAIQHELDHLDGVLFIDKLEPKKNAKN